MNLFTLSGRALTKLLNGLFNSPHVTNTYQVKLCTILTDDVTSADCHMSDTYLHVVPNLIVVV